MTRRCATGVSSRVSRSPSTTSSASPSSSTGSASTSSRPAGREPTRRTTSCSGARPRSSRSTRARSSRSAPRGKVKGKVDSDDTLRHLLAAGTSTVCIVGKSWDYHVVEALQTTLDEGVAMVVDSVAFLRADGRAVFFDAEHFFDGYRRNPEFSLRVLEGAAEAGRDPAGALRHERRHAAARGRADGRRGRRLLRRRRRDRRPPPRRRRHAAWPTRSPACAAGRSRCRARSTATASAPATATSPRSSRTSR